MIPTIPETSGGQDYFYSPVPTSPTPDELSPTTFTRASQTIPRETFELQDMKEKGSKTLQFLAAGAGEFQHCQIAFSNAPRNPNNNNNNNNPHQSSHFTPNFNANFPKKSISRQ